MLETISETQRAADFFARKNQFTTGPVEVSKRIEDGHSDFSIIDVREQEDFRKGHVPGATSLPKSQWQTMNGLNKDVTNIIYCYSPTCHLASQAAQLFASHGYPVMEMEGGFEVWKDKDLAVEK